MQKARAKTKITLTCKDGKTSNKYGLCKRVWKTSLLSSRRGLVKLQLLKKTLKLLPVATRQTFPCKYTFLTDSNASLWLFSSVNHETFLEIYFPIINSIQIQEKMAFSPPPVGLSWDSLHPPPESVRAGVRAYADVRTKIFRISRLPNLLRHGAPWTPL